MRPRSSNPSVNRSQHLTPPLSNIRGTHSRLCRLDLSSPPRSTYLCDIIIRAQSATITPSHFQLLHTSYHQHVVPPHASAAHDLRSPQHLSAYFRNNAPSSTRSNDLGGQTWRRSRTRRHGQGTNHQICCGNKLRAEGQQTNIMVSSG